MAKATRKQKTLIGAAQEALSAVKKNAWELGRLFSELRKESAPYEQNPGTGMSYAEAVKQIGIAYSTSLYFRDAYDVCNSAGFSQDQYVSLHDSGVSLGIDKYQFTRDEESWKAQIKELDASDVDNVRELAKKLKLEARVRESKAVAAKPTLVALAEEEKSLRAEAEKNENSTIKELIAKRADELKGELRDKRKQLARRLRDINMELSGLTDFEKLRPSVEIMIEGVETKWDFSSWDHHQASDGTLLGISAEL